MNEQFRKGIHEQGRDYQVRVNRGTDLPTGRWLYATQTAKTLKDAEKIRQTAELTTRWANVGHVGNAVYKRVSNCGLHFYCN